MATITYGCIARYVITDADDDDASKQKFVMSIEKEPKGYVIILRKSGGGKKTSTLVIPPQRWANLKLQMKSVCEAMYKVKKGGVAAHVNEQLRVSGNLHISIESPYWYVDMRQYYLNSDGELKPGRNGVSLKFQEWSKLCYQGVEMVNFHAPEIADLQPCATRIDHSSQEGAMECSECTPAYGCHTD